MPADRAATSVTDTATSLMAAGIDLPRMLDEYIPTAHLSQRYGLGE